MSSDNTNGKLGVLIVAHGGGEKWNSQVEKPAGILAEKHPEILVTTAYLFARGETPTPQTGYDKLVADGATRVVVLPFFISSHSFHYDEIRYMFGKIEHMDLPDGGGHSHLPEKVNLSVPIVEVLPAIDDSAFAAMQLVDALRSNVSNDHEINLVLIAHGPNDDDNARIWLKNMDGLMAHITNKLKIKESKCLLVRDDAGEEVRGKAVAEIKKTVEEISASGKTFVMPLLIARGHLSEEIPKMFSGVSCTFVGFSFANSEHIDEYFFNMVKSHI